MREEVKAELERNLVDMIFDELRKWEEQRVLHIEEAHQLARKIARRLVRDMT